MMLCANDVATLQASISHIRLTAKMSPNELLLEYIGQNLWTIPTRRVLNYRRNKGYIHHDLIKASSQTATADTLATQSD